MIDLSGGNSDAANHVDSLSDPAISIVAAQEVIVGAPDKRDDLYARPDGLRTFDSLIAAPAIAEDCALVSRNRKHFAMIEGLRLEAPPY